MRLIARHCLSDGILPMAKHTEHGPNSVGGQARSTPASSKATVVAVLIKPTGAELNDTTVGEKSCWLPSSRVFVPWLMVMIVV